MPIINRLSGAFPTSLVYITVGTLVVIWTVVTMVFNPPENYFWAAGFLATGASLLLIGLFLGPIGRAARHAELPPPEVTGAAAQAEQNAAARAPIVVPAAATIPGDEKAAMVAATSVAPMPQTPQTVPMR